MAPGVVAVAPEDSLADVCEVLRTQGVRRILVVDPIMQVQGIIGWADIAPLLSDRTMGQRRQGRRHPVVTSEGKADQAGGDPRAWSRVRSFARQRDTRAAAAVPEDGAHQFRLRANSSRDEGKPSRSSPEPTAAITEQSLRSALSRRRRPGAHSPASCPAPNQELGDADHHHRQTGDGQNRTRHDHRSPRFDGTRGFGGSRSSVRPRPAARRDVSRFFAEAGDAAHHGVCCWTTSALRHPTELLSGAAAGRRLDHFSCHRRLISHPRKTPAAKAAPRARAGRACNDIVDDFPDVAESLAALPQRQRARCRS